MRTRLRHPALPLALIFLSGAALCAQARAATGWIPPPSVTALLPTATFAPGSSHPIELTLRANGVPASLNWAASVGGAFVLDVSPASGSISVPADSVRRVTLSITVPAAAVGAASLSLEFTNQAGGGHVMKVTSSIFAATGGRPEVWPNPSTWAAVANTAGSMSFQVHSLLGAAESLVVTGGRSNPDPSNSGALFRGGALPTDVNLPGGATITVTASTTIAASAYAGNSDAMQCSMTSNEGISTALGFALVSAALPESLPAALYPVGVTPMSEDAAGRDGPV